MPPPLLRRLDAIASASISAFNDLIASLSHGRERDIDWWVSQPACRNNYVSDLFHQCVQTALIRQLLRDGESITVRTDSRIFASFLERMAEPRLTVQLCRGAGKRRMAWQDIAACLYHVAAAAYAAWRTRPSRPERLPDDLVAADIFVLRDSVKDGVFRDRYFPGLTDMLSSDQRSRFRYVPVFYRNRGYRALFGALRRNPVPFLLPQDYLSLADYLFAFGHWMRAGKFKGISASYEGLQIGALIGADLAAGRFAPSTIDALLAFRFWRRIAGEATLRRALDWYEGQNIDHALCAALTWREAPVPVIGFRPPCSKFEMSVTPAPHEISAGVTPRDMMVVGEGFRRDIQSVNPALHARIAPGLRFLALQTVKRRPSSGAARILVVLPLARDSLAGMRDLIDAVAGTSDLTWLIKPHPAMPRPEAEAIFENDRLTFVEGDLYNWLGQVDLIVGLESSSLLEAVAIGLPAICLARGNIPTKSPFPAWLDKRFWHVCYDAPEFQAAISASLAVAAPTDDELAELRYRLLSPADQVPPQDFVAELFKL